MAGQANRTCPSCGAALGAPDAGCPSCLLTLGLARPPAPPAPASADFPFAIVSTLGEGGMGTVYLADQVAPLKRQVALKVIKRGMDTRQVIARFEAERQALARMDHPTIARVFDAGETPSGQPFFSMEYVDGQRITDFADATRLPIPDRLQLFATLCDGVQHAHQKGIIHRDLKPSNILVTGTNGDATPKIIDFGIAKATESELTDDTFVTELGMVVGTPHYMSPEQAQLSALGVDTRSDVYSLGVILYELLTGARPFDAPGATPDEIRRKIREEAPSTLTAKLSVDDETSTALAANRGTDPQTLRRQLTGDLDWITLKALEKDPDRRYASAVDLAEDVRAHLTNQPIRARPPSTLYRLGKFVRRHRYGTAGAVAALAALVVFAATMTFQAGQIKRERDRADAERRDAERAALFLTDMIGGVEPDAMGRALWQQLTHEVGEAARRRGADDDTVEATRQEFRRSLAGVNPTEIARRLLDGNILAEAGQAVEAELGDDPLLAARLELTIGETYRELGLYERARPHLAEALARRERLLGRDHDDTLRARTAHARLLQDQGSFEEAESIFRHVLERRRTQPGGDAHAVIDATHDLGTVLSRQGRYDEALVLVQEAFDAQVALTGETHRNTLPIMGNLASILKELNRLDEALSLMRRSIEIGGEINGPLDRETLLAMNTLGFVLQGQGRHEEAEPIFRQLLDGARQTLGEDHPLTLAALSNLASSLRQQRKLDEAESFYLEALEGKRRVLGEDHPSTLLALNNMGAMMRSRGRLNEAESYFRQAHEGRVRVLGADHGLTIAALQNLGHVLARQGRLDEAEVCLVDSLEASERVLGDEHQTTLAGTQRLGELRERQGRVVDAQRLFELAIDRFKSALGDEHGLTINAINSLGWLYQLNGDLIGAEDRYREVLELRRRTRPEGHVFIAYALASVGRNLIAQQRFAEAEPLLSECVDIRRANQRAGDWTLAEGLALLGAAVAGQARYAEAEPLLLEAVGADVLPASGRLDRRREAIDHLTRLYQDWGRPDEAAAWAAQRHPATS